jgi:uncharacterized protein YecE (DUF72 family)
MPDRCHVYIGTSGWHYKHWVGDFYPARFPPAKMLGRYAQDFPTVEINNSFYRLPDEKTFRTWAQQVPPGFVFAVKASRFITHIKRLKAAEDSVNLLLSRTAPLGSTLGPILFQLPPQWKLNLQRLAEFLSVLPEGRRFVMEFREPSWFTHSVYELLRRRNVALCLHDWVEMSWPHEVTADFTYIRFHGSGQRYGGSYPNKDLGEWAERIRNWEGRLRQVFVYFNNDTGGHAINNAKTLRQMLGQNVRNEQWHGMTA